MSQFTMEYYQSLGIATPLSKFSEELVISWESLVRDNYKGLISLLNLFSDEETLEFQIYPEGQDSFHLEHRHGDATVSINAEGFMCPESWTKALREFISQILDKTDIDKCKKYYQQWLSVSKDAGDGDYYYFDDNLGVGGYDYDDDKFIGSALELPQPGAIIGMIFENSTFEFGTPIKKQ